MSANLLDPIAAPSDAERARRCVVRAHGIAHRRIDPDAFCDSRGPRAAAALLGLATGEEASRAVASRHDFDDYFLCSTVLSPLVMDDSSLGPAFTDALVGAAPCAANGITHVYECAGWGFLLRYVQQKARASGTRRLLLQIVDVDVHGFGYWRSNPKWGASGFGISTLVLEVGSQADTAIRLGQATQANALVQMGRALREFAHGRGATLALPFFPQEQRRALVKCLGGLPLHPDGHAQFGHSFGSDPWISLLMYLRSQGGCGDETVIVNSLALNGYFAMAAVQVDARTLWRLDGEAALPRRAEAAR